MSAIGLGNTDALNEVNVSDFLNVSICIRVELG